MHFSVFGNIFFIGKHIGINAAVTADFGVFKPVHAQKQAVYGVFPAASPYFYKYGKF